MKKRIVLALLLSGCEPDTTSAPTNPTTEVVSINEVFVDPIKRQLDDGYQLEVRALLAVERNLPDPPPKVDVTAKCIVDGKTFEDKGRAEFKNLIGAIPLAKRGDIVRLFFVPGLPKAPERCQLTLQLTKDSLGPHEYCYENKLVTPGKCKEVASSQ